MASSGDPWPLTLCVSLQVLGHHAWPSLDSQRKHDGPMTFQQHYWSLTAVSARPVSVTSHEKVTLTTLGKKYYVRSGNEGEKNLETEPQRPYARQFFSFASGTCTKGSQVRKLLQTKKKYLEGKRRAWRFSRNLGPPSTRVLLLSNNRGGWPCCSWPTWEWIQKNERSSIISMFMELRSPAWGKH